MMNRTIVLLATTAVTLFAASAAHASIITYFGEDANPTSSTTNSDTAQTQFLSNLASGVGTEDFESIGTGSYSTLPISFPGSTGSITATLTGDLTICPTGGSDCGAGRFAVSGTHYLASRSDAFGMTFSDPISAFGFYGTDIGDFGGQFTLTLTSGGTTTVTIPTSIGSGGSTSGHQMFWGFIDPALSYTAITFGNTSAGDDAFGFDDMTIGDLQQVQIGVPEPAGLAMFGLGLLGVFALLALRRRRLD